METQCRLTLASLLLAAPLCCNAADEPADCRRDDVDLHVREQILIYGPLSSKHEYFGFVYRDQGRIASAVVRGSVCVNEHSCGVHTGKAAKQIPRGSRVLGEWHTHPHQGSSILSSEDVRGAHNNRHIGCYTAYYALPNGKIYKWNPQKDSVPTAMASRVLIGDYSEEDS
jgi:proteasome lid subunit RPN8/RPN11